MYKFIKNNVLLVCSGSVLTGTIGLVFYLFLSKFNGSLSTEHSDWGAFGSYLSGTIGVLAACLAVIWLMKSVHLQKIELQHLKDELASSANEQKKQTHINALAALISSSRQAISEYQSDLIAMNDGNEHLHPLADKFHLHTSMEDEWRKITFYQKQISKYLSEQYIDPHKEKNKKEKLDEDEIF